MSYAVKNKATYKLGALIIYYPKGRWDKELFERDMDIDGKVLDIMKQTIRVSQLWPIGGIFELLLKDIVEKGVKKLYKEGYVRMDLIVCVLKIRKIREVEKSGSVELEFVFSKRLDEINRLYSRCDGKNVIDFDEREGDAYKAMFVRAISFYYDSEVYNEKFHVVLMDIFKHEERFKTFRMVEKVRLVIAYDKVKEEVREVSVSHIARVLGFYIPDIGLKKLIQIILDTSSKNNEHCDALKVGYLLNGCLSVEIGALFGDVRSVKKGVMTVDVGSNDRLYDMWGPRVRAVNDVSFIIEICPILGYDYSGDDVEVLGSGIESGLKFFANK